VGQQRRGPLIVEEDAHDFLTLRQVGIEDTHGERLEVALALRCLASDEGGSESSRS
jgi:hypothetical protein